MPSLVKIIRFGRPVLSAIAIGAWIGYRLFIQLLPLLLSLPSSRSRIMLIPSTDAETNPAAAAAAAAILQDNNNNVSLLHMLVDGLETLQQQLVLLLVTTTTTTTAATTSHQYCVPPPPHDPEHKKEYWLSVFAAALMNHCFLILQDILGMILLVGMTRLVYCLYHISVREWKDMISTTLFDWAKEHVPMIRSKLDQEATKTRQDFDQIIHKDPHRVRTVVLPPTGKAHDEIVQELQSHAAEENKKWQSGKITGTVYSDDVALQNLMHRVFAIYSSSNPLHFGYWPRVNECEGEVIAMTGKLLHAPTAAPVPAATPAAIGCVTSGGTDSIVLAIRAHLGYYGRRRHHIAHPELICGSTAHASVFKACDMFGIRCVMIDCNNNNNNNSPKSNTNKQGYSHYQLDPQQVRRHITSNTIMVYASTPCYPQGVIDPIPELSDLCLEYDIGLHVDACLGAFILPFCKDAPVFDFRNPGVTSMSADTHKYGYASKGSSVVLYRHDKLRHCQYFTYPNWTGGMYSTPTIAGSRSGAMSACAWAAMMAVGADGYQQRAQRIVQAARQMAAGIQAIPGLTVLTDQPFMIVCFASSLDNAEFNIYRVKDYMAEMEWGLATLQSPASLHMCITLNVVPKVDTFLKDLRKAVQQVRAEGNKGFTKGTAGIYGMASSLPPGPVEHLLNVFTDMTLSP